MSFSEEYRSQQKAEWKFDVLVELRAIRKAVEYLAEIERRRSEGMGVRENLRHTGPATAPGVRGPGYIDPLGLEAYRTWEQS